MLAEKDFTWLQSVKFSGWVPCYMPLPAQTIFAAPPQNLLEWTAIFLWKEVKRLLNLIWLIAVAAFFAATAATAIPWFFFLPTFWSKKAMVWNLLF